MEGAKPKSKKKKRSKAAAAAAVVTSESEDEAAPGAASGEAHEGSCEFRDRLLPSNLSEAKDIFVTALDEVCLEGLDGITIEALWKRIRDAMKITTWMPRQLQNLVWKHLVRIEDIACFELKTPRPELVIMRRFEAHNPNIVQNRPDEIYPFAPINDKINGVVGSCSTYFERADVTEAAKKLTLCEALEAFGNRLVLVASGRFRSEALTLDLSIPILELSDVQYQLLERVGRSRREGELTYGANSLVQMVGRDAKTLFYYRKTLHKHHLILKQSSCMHTKEGSSVKGCILHLPRFYTDIKSKQQVIMEQIVRLLKSKPSHRMEIFELKKLMGPNWSKYNVRRLSKMPEFKALVKRDFIRYRDLYPDALPSEWMKVSSSEEKNVAVYMLIKSKPEAKPTWKEEDSNPSSSDDEELGTYCHNLPLINDIYATILDSGKVGLSLLEIQKRKPFDFYTIRGILKTLQKRNMLTMEKMDAGRVRYTKYLASCFSAEEMKPERSAEIEEPLGDDVFEFIGNVLGVEAKYVRPKPEQRDIEIVEENRFKGSYGLMSELKRKRRSKDAEESGEAKRRMAELLANKEDFVGSAASRNLGILRGNLEVRPELTDEFQEVLRGVAGGRAVGEDKTLYAGKVKANESRLDSRLVERCARKWSVSKGDFKMRMRHFKMFLNVVPQLTMSYQLYINRNKAVLGALTKDLRKALPKSLVSSDEEEDGDCDADSLDGNCADGEVSRWRSCDEDYKLELIGRFEEVERVKVEVGEKRVREVEEEVEASLAAEEVDSRMFGVKYEMFYGPKPIVHLREDCSDGMEVAVILSSKPEDFDIKNRILPRQRIKSRINYIKQCVQKHLVISDMYKIQYWLQAKEREEGYKSLADKMSLHRIYEIMVADGIIKAVKMIVRCQGVVRCRTIICWSTVNVDELLSHNLEAFKITVFLYARRKNNEKLEAGTSAARTVYKPSRNIGMVYGYSPKATKMKILHEFLFYLTYAYDGALLPPDKAREALSAHGRQHFSEQVFDECSPVYRAEVSWRTFLSPIPKYKVYPKGWILIYDAIFRMPLCLFVRLVKVAYVIPELPGRYLNNAIRKNFLVKDLPADIKDALMKNRRYIFVIYDILNLLCYMGLLQFGAQKFKEKDQIFVYLNRNAILFDTSSSGKGYHQVTRKPYPMIRYRFDAAEDVTKYWGDMHITSMSSKLGLKSLAKNVVALEQIHNKPDFAEWIKPQTVQSAAERDVGYLPGDRLGACCVDSMFWLHLKRNWTYVTRKEATPEKKPRIGEARKRYMDTIKPMKFGDFISERNRLQAKENPAKKVIKKKKKAKLRLKSRALKPKCRWKMKGMDLVDKKILDVRGSLKSRYTEEEDTALKICWDVINYLCPTQKKRNVTNTTIRDFMHRVLPYSEKTSSAYRRRILALKCPKLKETTKKMNYIDLNADQFTQKYFFKIREKLSTLKATDAEVNLTFLHLAYFTYRNWKFFQKSPGVMNVKDYLQESAIAKFKPKDSSVYGDPGSVADVTADTIKAVIHSSLCVSDAPPSLSYELLQVYQTYPEASLRSALAELRLKQLVSHTKGHLADSYKNSSIICGNSYHLSFVYIFKQITKYPEDVFVEANDFLVNYVLKAEGPEKTVGDLSHGHGLGLNEMATVKRLRYSFDFPEEVITLDPTVKDHRKLVECLALRYQKLMDQEYYTEKNEALQRQLDHFMRVSRGEVAAKDEGNTLTLDRRLKISDWAFLMTRGVFPDMDEADQLENLNKHFVIKHPTCSLMLDGVAEGLEPLGRGDIVGRMHRVLEKHRQRCLIASDAPDVPNIMRKVKHLPVDETAVEALLDFIAGKEELGATSADLKERFRLEDLDEIVAVLQETKAVLRAGVVRFRFVHCAYAKAWTIQASRAKAEERLMVCPWMLVDGTFNRSELLNWLAIVLSHCMSNPFKTFRNLSTRFCYIKPVDIYSLLEILQDLTCLQIMAYEEADKSSLFHDATSTLEVSAPAKLLDALDNVFVIVDRFATLKFGAVFSPDASTMQPVQS